MTEQKYTREWLKANGWKRVEGESHRGPGFTEYTRTGKCPGNTGFLDHPRPHIAFVGNASFMEAWTEEHWKGAFPHLYAWYKDPKQTQPFLCDGSGRLGGTGRWTTFIKGEDPELLEMEGDYA